MAAMNDFRAISAGLRTSGPDTEMVGRDALGPIYRKVTPTASPTATTSSPMSTPQGTVMGKTTSMPGQNQQAMQWMPQQVSGSTATSTRTIGDMPELPEYEELDEGKLKSRTQEFSALGRREARGNFQDLLSRLYGANPDDPYARNLARQASQGFSIDTQRAISAGAKEALGLGMSEQAQRNQRVMTAFQAAVNKVLNTATTTSTTSYDYEPQPMQTAPTMGMQPNIMQQALSKKFDPTNPLSLGQPYTYG